MAWETDDSPLENSRSGRRRRIGRERVDGVSNRISSTGESNPSLYPTSTGLLGQPEAQSRIGSDRPIGAADHQLTVLRRLTAEAIGSLLLSATVIGSGVMAARLSAHNDAVALLANTFATVAVLVVLINLLAPISGAHFNPVVSLVQAMCKSMSWREAGGYAVVQVVGCCAGALLAHEMFELNWWESSTHVRTGAAQWLSEAVATGRLILVILGHRRPSDAPWMVSGWIGAAYWFTASTSFANPAITIARSLSDTFAGIRPLDVPLFIVSQATGAVLAFCLSRWLFERFEPRSVSSGKRT